MSIRINLEIGHEASIRTKRTHEGFTHDWKVYVKGCEHAHIQYYVEKIVFHLHETFPKPKRVVKEPPYSLKESGYAGFTLPIDIYLKNREEPKKISFNYDLNLQPNGPALVKVQKEKYVFNVTNEEFKARLLKGGGVLVNSGSQELNRDVRPLLDEKSQLVSKPRLGGLDFIKKHKPKQEDRVPDSFHELFGTPITKNCIVTVDSKCSSKDKNSNVNNKTGSSEKEKSKSKHIQHKDKEKEKVKEKTDSEKKSKDEKRREEKKEHKDREKKERREKSPKARSPTPTKRLSSPKRLHSPISLKYKEEKKADILKEKRSSEDKDKLEKKSKKEKRDKDRDKHKEGKHKEKESQRSSEQQQKEIKNVVSIEKEKHRESFVRDKEQSPLPTKSEKKEKMAKEKEIPKEYIRENKETEYIHKNGKVKSDRTEDKPKHKHKKKDKDRKDKDRSNEKEKSHKSDKKSDRTSMNPVLKYENSDESLTTQKENEKSSLFSSPKNNVTPEIRTSEKSKKPLTQLFVTECGDSDTSNASLSSNENAFNETATVKVEPKKEPIFEVPFKPEKQKVKKEKTKKNKEKKAEKKDGEKKRKRKLEVDHAEEPIEKIIKEDPSSRDSDTEQLSAATDMSLKNVEYRSLLKELRGKILQVKDNNELQKIAEIIAASGKFRISAHTIDFDLTSLDQSTVARLQNYFDNS